MIYHKGKKEHLGFEPYSISDVQYESIPYIFIESDDISTLSSLSVSQTASDDFLSDSSIILNNDYVI